MQYHTIGQTGLQVSAIGLGGEHLLHASREAVVEVVHAALDAGVNYLDLIWAHPEYRDNFAAALRGRRDQAVVTTIPGVAELAELHEALALFSATDEERDFGGMLADFQEYVQGECVYCNHCLPCPAEIDIGRVSRLLDVAGDSPSPALWAEYAALPAKAAACTACGACAQRCPFGVPVIDRMRRAAGLFEAFPA